MLLPSLLLSLLLPLSVLSSPSARLEKLQKLSNAAPDGVIRLNSALYDEFTAQGGKEGQDYGLSVVLTALKAQFNCVQCREFDTQYGMVAKQWHRSAKSDKPVFFASLDFPDGQEVFRRLGLTTAPVLKFFHPVEPDSRSKPTEDAYEFRQGLAAGAFASWLVNIARQPVSFTYRTPIDYSKLLTYLFFTLAVIITFYRHWKTLSPLITGRWIWSFLSLGFILTMNAGYMWNQIRHPPYMAPGRDGKGVQMIAGGYSNQYGVETHIISGIYASLAISIIIIITLLPKIKSEKSQRVGVYLWVGMFLVMHAVLTGLFKVKSPGYPYGLYF